MPPVKTKVVNAGAQATLTESVTDQIVDDIVHGRLEPGSKLPIEELKAMYRMGASPLREALTRLLALGFVTNESRRGFRVAAVSQRDLAEITEIRKLIEIKALDLSLRNGGRAWEEGVVMQMARLRHAIRRSETEGYPLDASSDGVHEDYHRALIAGCGSPRLIGLQETYYDLAKRCRLLVFKSFLSREKFLERHEELTDIVLSGSPEKACSALSEHLDLIVSELLVGLPADQPAEQ